MKPLMFTVFSGQRVEKASETPRPVCRGSVPCVRSPRSLVEFVEDGDHHVEEVGDVLETFGVLGSKAPLLEKIARMSEVCSLYLEPD